MDYDPSPKNIINDMQSKDPKLQCRAIKNISKLEGKIKPDQFRKEFIQFLINCINEEEDEVLAELCHVSKYMLECIGGKKYLKNLFPLVELLLHTCDPSIRKEVIQIFRHLIDGQDEFTDIEKELFETIQKLGNSEFINQQLGFIAFSSEFFGDFSEKYRGHIFNLFKQYMERSNQNKLLKIELSANLTKLSNHLNKNDFIELYTILTKEKYDSVRFNLVEGLVSLRTLDNLSGYESFIGQSISDLRDDESWRVRLMLAKYIPEILEISTMIEKEYKEIKNIVVKTYLKLLQDKEGEVRSMSCQNLEKAAETYGQDDNFDKILGALKILNTDPLTYVRNSLASSLLTIAPKIGEAKTKEYIFPLFLELLKDKDHDIRMVLIKKLDKLHEVIKVDSLVAGIIPSLVEISNNSDWRIRNEIAETLPVFVRIVSRKAFLDNFMPIYMKWLTDPVYIIRQNICKKLRRLYDIFKGEDFEKKLLSKLNSMYKSDNYLTRITVVKLAKEFLDDEYDLEFMEKKLFPLINKLSGDKIANVRQNCAVVIKKLVRLSRNKDVIKECKGLIDELKRDKDPEVVYAISDN